MYDVHGDIEVEELMTSGFVVWLGIHLRRGSVIVSKVKKDKRTRYSGLSVSTSVEHLSTSRLGRKTSSSTAKSLRR